MPSQPSAAFPWEFEERMGASRTQTLAQLAASIAVGATEVAYTRIAACARPLGVTDGEVLGTLLAVAPIVGDVRVAAAAPHIATAIGYDLEAAFERLE